MSSAELVMGPTLRSLLTHLRGLTMSSTERARRWCKQATDSELGNAATSLTTEISDQRNPMVRSSLRKQLQHVQAELQRRRGLSI